MCRCPENWGGNPHQECFQCRLRVLFSYWTVHLPPWDRHSFSSSFFASTMPKRWWLSIWQNLQVKRMCWPLSTHHMWQQGKVQGRETQGHLCLPRWLAGQPLRFLHRSWLSITRWLLLWWEMWLSKPGVCQTLCLTFLCPRCSLWGKEPQRNMHLQLPLARRWLHFLFTT